MALSEARAYLDRLTRSLGEEGFDIGSEVLTGSPPASILDYAQKIRADMIAMSTHGRSGIGRWVYGSVADRVLCASPCPVLLTRSGVSTTYEANCIERVLVPLDGSPVAESVLPYASAIARAFGAELILLRVTHGPSTVYPLPESIPVLAAQAESNEHEARAYLLKSRMKLERDGLRVRLMTIQPPVAEAILDVAREEQVSLIAMTTHGRSGVRRWIYGSVAERVLHGAATPILLVRPFALERGGLRAESAEVYTRALNWGGLAGH
jgi:nucleotide-binding universal stress UspA family protein